MSRTNIISVSLPKDILDKLDALQKSEDRPRSTIIRRALVEYMMKDLSETSPLSGDREAIATGTKEYTLGKVTSLENIKSKYDVESRTHTKRRKGTGPSR